MHQTSAAIETILTVLAATPHRLASLTSGLDNARLHVTPDNDAWSVHEILAHLRACADVWGQSILTMITQGHPTLSYVSPRTWIRKTDYQAQEFHISLQDFANQRNHLLRLLKLLAIEDWSRGATFTGTVKGREQTVFSYAQRLAEHETQHLEQIESILNRVQT